MGWTSFRKPYRRWGPAGATAAVLAGVVVTAVAVVAPRPASAAAGCQASYSIASQWSGGFSANVSITNLGDSYADPEPNGNIIFDTIKCSWITNACGSAPGPELVEYNPSTNTMTQISEPPDSSGQAVNFINLPNGQVLAAAGNRDWIYTPVGTPQASWRPTVSSVTANGNGSYHVTGTQLTGLVTVGEDDYQDPQNFPIVYLKNSAGNVFYARSFNFSTMAPSSPGEVESADFTPPSGLPHGTYSVFVSACGVSSSTGVSFTF